jgi:hypothetical protein
MMAEPEPTPQEFLTELRQSGLPWEILLFASGTKGAALERLKLRYIAAGAVPNAPETILRFLKRYSSSKRRWVSQCFEYYSKPATVVELTPEQRGGITPAMAAAELLRRERIREATRELARRQRIRGITPAIAAAE